MGYNLGPVLSVGGEAEYTAAMKRVKESMTYVKAEANAAISVFDKNEKSVQSLTTQINNSKKAFDVQKTAVKAAEDALERMKKNGVDEASTAYQRMEANLNNAKAALNNTEKEINDQEKELKQAADAADEMARAEKTMGDHAKRAGTEMKGAGDNAKGFKGQLKDFAKSSVGQMATIAGAVALATKAFNALWETFDDAANWADALNTLSQQTGLATEQLQKFEYTARFVDTSVETITGSLKKLSTNMYQASIGTKQQKDAFEALGVKYEDANGNLRDNQLVFFEMIDALGKMTNETERDAIAMVLMGRSAQDLNPLIKAGSEALKYYGEEADNSGVIISEGMVGALQVLDDKMQRSTAKTESNGRRMAAVMSDVGMVMDDFKYMADNLVPLVQYGIWYNTTKILSQANDEVMHSYENLKVGASAAGISIDDFSTKVNDMTYAILVSGDGATSWEEAYSQAYTNVVYGIDEVTYATNTMATAQAAWDEQVNTALETYITKQAEYQAAVAQTSASYLSDMGGFFDGFNAELAGSQGELDRMTTSLLENLQSQVDGIEGWADEMDKLSKRGIDEGLLQELRDMGPEAYAEIQALNNATDIQLEVYEGLYKTRSEAATEAAKTALEPMAGDVADALDAAEKVIEDRNAAMKTLGTNLAKGIGDGIDAGTWYVEKETREVINAAIAAAKKAGKIQSPSKLMSDEVGLYLGQGVGVGFMDSIKAITPNIEDAMRSMAFNLSDSVPSSLGAMSASAPATVTNTTREIIRDSGFQPQFGDVHISTDMDIKTLAQKLAYEYKRALAAQGGGSI